jgi:hypothetical protein
MNVMNLGIPVLSGLPYTWYCFVFDQTFLNICAIKPIGGNTQLTNDTIFENNPHILSKRQLQCIISNVSFIHRILNTKVVGNAYTIDAKTL